MKNDPNSGHHLHINDNGTPSGVVSMASVRQRASPSGYFPGTLGRGPGLTSGLTAFEGSTPEGSPGQTPRPSWPLARSSSGVSPGCERNGEETCRNEVMAATKGTPAWPIITCSIPIRLSSLLTPNCADERPGGSARCMENPVKHRFSTCI